MPGVLLEENIGNLMQFFVLQFVKSDLVNQLQSRNFRSSNIAYSGKAKPFFDSKLLSSIPRKFELAGVFFNGNFNRSSFFLPQIISMKVAITNLNSRTTTVHLQRLFNPYGFVRSIKIMHDDQAGRSACYGVVRIDYPYGLMAIAALNNLLFMDHYLEVYEMDA